MVNFELVDFIYAYRRCKKLWQNVQYDGNKISIARSHVSRRASRTFKPKLRTVTFDVNGESKKMCVCSKCLRSLKNA